MNRQEFVDLIKTLYLYFNKTRPADTDQIDMWFEDVNHIPGGEPLTWIKTQFKESKSLPFNIPLEIKSYWRLYQKAHREKIVPEQYEYCNDCYGHGTHMYERPFDGRWVSEVAACRKCSNWKKHFGTVAYYGGKTYIEKKPVGLKVDEVWKTTRQEIIDKGYQYLLQSNPRATGEISADDVKKLAKDLFELTSSPLYQSGEKTIPHPKLTSSVPYLSNYLGGGDLTNA